MTPRETLHRRTFLGTLAIGGAGLVVPSAEASPVASAPSSAMPGPTPTGVERSEQRLHVDGGPR